MFTCVANPSLREKTSAADKPECNLLVLILEHFFCTHAANVWHKEGMASSNAPASCSNSHIELAFGVGMALYGHAPAIMSNRN